MQWKEKWNDSPNPKTVLVQPPLSKEYSAVETTFNPAPPTWAAILAKQTLDHQDSEFQVFYPPQADMSDNFIKKCADAHILGLTDWFSCHESAMEITKRAKKENPELLVVIGGINAKYLAQRILLNHPYIDLVVSGDGEDILWRIQAGHQFSTIPNLWYRTESGEIKFSYVQDFDLDKIPPWDFNDLIIPKVLQDYRKNLNLNPAETVPLGVSMTRGCQKCQESGPCIYCTAYGRYRETKPENALAQLQHLETEGFKYLFETGDDFSDLNYFKSLASLRTDKDSFKLRCYVNPLKVNIEVAEAMAQVGIYEIFLGLETISNIVVVKANRPPISLEVIDNAIQQLSRVGINVCLPIIFGLPGETKETALKTSEAIISLVGKYSNIRMVLVSLAIPLIGSLWFNQLIGNREVVRQYKGDLNVDDSFDYFQLLKIFLKENGVDIGQIIEVLDQLRIQLKDKVEVGKFGGIEN